MTADRLNNKPPLSSTVDLIASHDRLWWHIRFIYGTIAALTVCLVAVLGTAAAMYFWHESHVRNAAYSSLDITDDVMGTGISGLRWARGVTTTKPETTAARHRQWQYPGEKSDDETTPRVGVVQRMSILDVEDASNDDDDDDDDDSKRAVSGADGEEIIEPTVKHRTLRMGHRKKRSDRKDSKKLGHQMAASDDNGDDETGDADAGYDADDSSEVDEIQQPKQSLKQHGRGTHRGRISGDSFESPPTDGSRDNSGLWLTTYSKIPVSVTHTTTNK